MKLTSLSASLGLLAGLASAAPAAVPTKHNIPRDYSTLFQRYPVTPRDLSSEQVQRDLGNKLSKDALIFGPEDDRFHDATSRWTEFSKPTISVVIQPGKESDVSTIVKYCNANSIDFLATSGGHGLSAQLKSFNGIQISMRQLNSISIQPSKKSVRIEGGAIVGEVIHYLWDRGYVTTTGGCECVGMLGAGLGGGHGRFEGFYGMISDNILSLQVVLGDGRSVKVDSKGPHADLLWGMRGAGHNLGIVTSYEMNLYPRGPELWHYHNFIYAGDKLEQVFEAANRFHNNGSTPVNAAFNVGTFAWNDTLKEPVLVWSFSYRGPAGEAEQLLAPFNAIESLHDEQGDVPYKLIAKAQSTDMDSPICQHGNIHTTSTAGLQVYNLTAERLIFEGFRRRATEDPVLAAGTAILHEGYSTAGVDRIPSESSAYPFRSDHHLMLFMSNVPHGDEEMLTRSWAWAAEVRDHWNAGQPTRTVNAYVNYASGFESLEEKYGHESWRLERLRGLKQKYDPTNKFRFYNPIVPQGRPW